MLIGDHGKVIELKHIRWLIGGTLFLLLCAVLAAVVLFVNNQKLSSANDNLRQSLETSRARMKKVRQQTDLLMAQLALAEARAKEDGHETTLPSSDATDAADEPGEKDKPPAETQVPSKVVSKSPSKPEIKPPPKPKPKPAAKPKPAVKPGPTASESAIPVPAPEDEDASENVVMVEIDDLQLKRPSGSSTINLEFKLRNVSPKPQRLEGRVLAILRGDDLSPNQWITIPNVKLVDGKPAEIRGHRFAINNWRTMRMRTNFSGSLDKFNLVEIYVYAGDGKIWLRELEPVKPQ